MNKEKKERTIVTVEDILVAYKVGKITLQEAINLLFPMYKLNGGKLSKQ